MESNDTGNVTFSFEDINFDFLNDHGPPQSNISMGDLEQCSTQLPQQTITPQKCRAAKVKKFAHIIANTDELVTKIKRLESELATMRKEEQSFKRSAQEIQSLYETERAANLKARSELTALRAEYDKLDMECANKSMMMDQMSAQLDGCNGPIPYDELVQKFFTLLSGNESTALNKSQFVSRLRTYCHTKSIQIAHCKSPKKKAHMVSSLNKSTQTDPPPVEVKQTKCTATQCMLSRKVTCSRGVQYISTVTTRSTSTQDFIVFRDAQTSCPEPEAIPPLSEILVEMAQWHQKTPISPILDPIIPAPPKTVPIATQTTGTCTLLCNINREIDYLPIMSSIKRSDSRPASVVMFENIKNELRTPVHSMLSRSQSCQTDDVHISPESFSHAWRIFGLMLMGLLPHLKNSAYDGIGIISSQQEFYERFCSELAKQRKSMEVDEQAEAEVNVDVEVEKSPKNAFHAESEKQAEDELQNQLQQTPLPCFSQGSSSFRPYGPPSLAESDCSDVNSEISKLLSKGTKRKSPKKLFAGKRKQSKRTKTIISTTPPEPNATVQHSQTPAEASLLHDEEQLEQASNRSEGTNAASPIRSPLKVKCMREMLRPSVERSRRAKVRNRRKYKKKFRPKAVKSAAQSQQLLEANHLDSDSPAAVSECSLESFALATAHCSKAELSIPQSGPKRSSVQELGKTFVCTVDSTELHRALELERSKGEASLLSSPSVEAEVQDQIAIEANEEVWLTVMACEVDERNEVKYVYSCRSDHVISSDDSGNDSTSEDLKANSIEIPSTGLTDISDSDSDAEEQLQPKPDAGSKEKKSMHVSSKYPTRLQVKSTSDLDESVAETNAVDLAQVESLLPAQCHQPASTSAANDLLSISMLSLTSASIDAFAPIIDTMPTKSFNANILSSERSVSSGSEDDSLISPISEQNSCVNLHPSIVQNISISSTSESNNSPSEQYISLSSTSESSSSPSEDNSPLISISEDNSPLSPTSETDSSVSSASEQNTSVSSVAEVKSAFSSASKDNIAFSSVLEDCRPLSSASESNSPLSLISEGNIALSSVSEDSSPQSVLENKSSYSEDNSSVAKTMSLTTADLRDLFGSASSSDEADNVDRGVGIVSPLASSSATENPLSDVADNCSDSESELVIDEKSNDACQPPTHPSKETAAPQPLHELSIYGGEYAPTDVLKPVSDEVLFCGGVYASQQSVVVEQCMGKRRQASPPSDEYSLRKRLKESIEKSVQQPGTKVASTKTEQVDGKNCDNNLLLNCKEVPQGTVELYECSGPASPAAPDSDVIAEPKVLTPVIQIPLEPQGYRVQGNKSLLEHYVDRYKVEHYNMMKYSRKEELIMGKLKAALKPFVNATNAGHIDITKESDAVVSQMWGISPDIGLICRAIVSEIRDAARPAGELQPRIEFIPLSVPLQRAQVLLKCLQTREPAICANLVAKIENTLFNVTNVNQISVTHAINLTQLYMMVLCSQLETMRVCAARLFIAKCLYFYTLKAQPMIFIVLGTFPSVLPHREDRSYDRSDPLISVIQHILMCTNYKMERDDLCSKPLLSKLRFQYHFETWKPTKEEIITNLMEKLNAGRLHNVSYAFAIFCKRSCPKVTSNLVLTSHLLPLASSFYNQALLDSTYDDRVATLLTCISMIVKPIDVSNDVEVYLTLFSRFLVATNRPIVQEAAVQAILRLQRFGSVNCFNQLIEFKPNYPISAETQAMLRTFVHRRTLKFWTQLLRTSNPSTNV